MKSLLAQREKPRTNFSRAPAPFRSFSPAIAPGMGPDNSIRWKGERLHHLFERRCDASPDREALIIEDASFTFRMLDDRANQTARFFLDQGLKAGDRVAILLDKSIHSYAALLAVLKIGAAYVPLDPSFPSDRIAFILDDANAGALISTSRFSSKLGTHPIKQIMVDCADKEIKARDTARLGDRANGFAAGQLFYVIYTSGTTGKPKGVAIEHAGICNFVKVAGEVYGIRPGDRCYQGMTLAFDFHVEDLWVPLIAGATLIAGKSGVSLFGGELHAFLHKHRVTVFPCVPTLWATIEEDLPHVRIVLLSGEAVPHNLVVRWHRPERHILNAYGPTECSVSSTLRRLVPESNVTIGRPLPSYTAVILNENKDEVIGKGEIGEIGIAGVALASGYLNRDDLTRQKFIPDFLNLPNNPSKRIYRTGDYGRIREDGELEFHGRIDTQVKIRGYRIELGEIESMLLQLPHIANAVVNPHAAEGVVELVAYYTAKQGAEKIPASEVIERLRSQLPGYMVPSYLEELPFIPMTSNNKVDRRCLPAPKSPRLAASKGKYAAPATSTEKALESALIEVLKVERASLHDNFFEDLGAHSLLMAQFCAGIRKSLRISAVSMRDIYQNPTIAKLAAYLESLPADKSSGTKPVSNKKTFYVPPDRDYYTCAVLQLLWYAGWAAAGLWLFVWSTRWTYAAMPDLGAAYLRIIGLSLAFAIVFSVLPIAAKWLVIGRWKRETIPIWSLRYFRFWAIRNLVAAAPIARFGDPFYNLYLRLLGARIGANAVIHSQYIPVCADLISIGANSSLCKGSLIRGYVARSNQIHIGPIRIGSHAFVGEAAVLDINTVMEDNTQLGTASSLHAGQRIPRGKRYHGCPAQETKANYCKVDPRKCSGFRRWAYAAILLAAGFALVPMPVLLAYYLFPAAYDFVDGSRFLAGAGFGDWLVLGRKVLLITSAAFLGAGVLALLAIGVIPRLLNELLNPERPYVLYGVHYFIHQLIVAGSNSFFFNRLFGDSSAIVHYLRWAGYKLNKIIQTGSNFGLAQAHDNPFHCDIGTGTMVSGGLKMVNETLSSTAFKIGKVKIGEQNYIGNYVHVPAHSKAGVNCLVATKALVPIDGPVRENVGLLGSPCFEIPRSNDRDKQLALMDDATKKEQLAKKNRYNFVTAVLYLLTTWFAGFVLAFSWLVALIYYPLYGMGSVYTAAAFSLTFAILWFWFVERASLHFGRLSPRIVPLLHEYFWYHERTWKLTGLWLIAPAFAGTPFKNLFSWMEGVRLGKRVFDDGCYFDEYSLIEIGDYSNLNAMCVIQPHSLEESVFKSGRVRIGTGCTLGVASNLHYDVTVGDYSVIETNSFLMKGEIVDSDSVWRGNPARAADNPSAAEKPPGFDAKKRAKKAPGRKGRKQKLQSRPKFVEGPSPIMRPA